MYLLYFYVPQNHADKVKDALFSTGAGKFRNYDKCAFQTSGKGQFRPLEGADPYLGKINALEYVDEVKIEMICHDDDIDSLRKTLLDVHPYEEPAYGFIRIFY